MHFTFFSNSVRHALSRTLLSFNTVFDIHLHGLYIQTVFDMHFYALYFQTVFDNTFTHFTFIQCWSYTFIDFTSIQCSTCVVFDRHFHALYFYTVLDIYFDALYFYTVFRSVFLLHKKIISYVILQCSNSSILPSTKIKIPINFLYDSVCLIMKNSPKFSR